ncbi:hypothetical protein KKA23_00875 [Patescibacteria group bacterium]|nr:hypothetical protein [Patescibacteria group bacterium]
MENKEKFKQEQGPKEKDVKIFIEGMGWKAEKEAKIEGDKISLDLEKFKDLLGILSETHDTVGGGFSYEIEDKEEKKSEEEK